MKKRIVAMLCLMAMLLSMSTLGMLAVSAGTVGDGDFVEAKPVENLDYSFAILGDPQTVIEYEVKNQNKYKGFTNMFTWITKNRESRKIEYLLCLGDTIDTLYTYPASYNPIYNNRVEWEKARTNFKKLNGILPYMVVRGNHDDEIGYHTYICTTEYQNQILKDANGNEVGGFYYDSSKTATMGNSMSNCYRKLEVGNHKYLMLGLDFSIGDSKSGDDVIAWANGIIEANPDYKVIISVHAYLDSNGNRIRGDISQSNADRTETEAFFFSGNRLWDSLIKKHSNVFMVFSGHISVDDPVVTKETGTNGNQIINILVDPQATYEEGKLPLAMVLMMNVTNGGKKLEFEYISTDKNQQLSGSNRFTIDLPAGTLPEFTRIVAEETTEATTVTEASIDIVSEEVKKGCNGAILSTVTVCCAMGTSLAAFAMRKKKED